MSTDASAMPRIIATATAATSAVAVLVFVLAVAFGLYIAAVDGTPSDPGGMTVATLAAIAIAGAVGATVAWFAVVWWTAGGLGASKRVTYIVTLPLAAIALFYFVGFIAYTNCCHFSSSFPLPQECRC